MAALLTAEFIGTDRNPNTKGTTRLMEMTTLEDGRVRVRISGAPFLTNDPPVVICDEVLDATHVANLILPNLPPFTRVILDARKEVL